MQSVLKRRHYTVCFTDRNIFHIKRVGIQTVDGRLCQTVTGRLRKTVRLNAVSVPQKTVCIERVRDCVVRIGRKSIDELTLTRRTEK